jgi:hypothetical protein
MSRISTRHLNLLPNVDRLKALLQSLAILDAIMSPEWQFRYYPFDSKWSSNEQMGSMRDGSGDQVFVLFNADGCFIKGFAHESSMAPCRTQPPEIWPGLLDGVPDEFSAALTEPAFSMDDITFCVWRRNSDQSWSHGPIDFPVGIDPDGSENLLAIPDGDPENYRQFVEDYYETTVPVDAVRHIYNHLPLTESVVVSLNPELGVKDLADDLATIGYSTNKAT